MRFRPLLILLICFVSPSLTRIHQMLKKGLLQQLGLEKEPELARPTLPVPDHVWSLYEDVMEERNHADWIRHYYPQSLLEENSGLFLSFNLSLAASKQEQVTRAELRLKLRANQIGYIYVFSGQNFTENVASLVSTTEPWTIVDISKAFVGQQPELLEMRIAIPPDVKLEAPEAHTVSQMAFVKKQSVSLIVYSELQEPSRVRRKRSTAAAANQVPTRRRKGRKQHRLGVDKNLCQLKELYVDFEELNWQDWILAPKGYEAGQCGGNCPHPIPAHLNATNHAIIQSLLHSLNPQIPPPCCVPTETSSLAILYMDMENRIVIKNYPEMRVEACGCR